MYEWYNLEEIPLDLRLLSLIRFTLLVSPIYSDSEWIHMKQIIIMLCYCYVVVVCRLIADFVVMYDTLTTHGIESMFVPNFQHKYYLTCVLYLCTVPMYCTVAHFELYSRELEPC